MKAAIKIEYDADNYDIISAILGALECACKNYDCIENNFRSVKGTPSWSQEEIKTILK